MGDEGRNNLLAFSFTLFAIIALVISGALICVIVDAKEHLAEIVAALGFIGSGITGLIAVAGGFRFGTSKPLVDNSTNTNEAAF